MEFKDEFNYPIENRSGNFVTRRSSMKFRMSMLVRDEKGVAVTLVALVLPVLLFAFALTIDIGFSLSERSSMQQAADNAVRSAAVVKALNGATSAEVRNEAYALASANGYTNGVDGVTVNVNIPPTSGNKQSDSAAVEVVITKRRGNLLSGFVGNSTDIGARAVSSFTSPPCVIALRSNPNGTTGITFNGGGDYRLDCAIYSNSTNKFKSISLNGRATVTTPYAGMAGCTNGTIANMECNITPVANPYASVLAQVPNAAPSGTTTLTNPGNKNVFPDCANSAGCVVPSSIIDKQGNVQFGSGKYFVTGSALSLAGNSKTFSSNGATIWFENGLTITGNSTTMNVTNSVFLFPPASGGGFLVTGSSTKVASMSPPTSGPYSGFSTVDASTPSPSVIVGFRGDSTDLSNGMGILLSPNNDLRFGNSTDLSKGCFSVVAATVTFNGSTDLKSTCLNKTVNLAGYVGGRLTE